MPNVPPKSGLPPYFPSRGPGSVGRQGFHPVDEAEQMLRAMANVGKRAESEVIDSFTEGVRPIDESGGWAEYALDLSGVAPGSPTLTKPAIIDTCGYGLLYRRENSVPMGRLNIIGSSGQLTDFYPGMKIRGFARKYSFLLSSRSVQAGFARILVATRRNVDFDEPHVILPGEVFQPVDLLGTSVGATFVSVTQNTQPTGTVAGGNLTTGAFQYTGFKSLRLYVDTLSSNQSTFTLVPWFYDLNTTLWAPQDLAAIQSPAPQAATRYRTLYFDVAGSGYMFFEIRAAPGNLGMIVQGIG